MKPTFNGPMKTPAVTSGPWLNVNAGKCLDVANVSQANGAQVQLWDCIAGQADQQWTPTPARELRVYGNKCLDAGNQGTADDTQAVIWDCNGGADQQRTLNADGSITGVQSGKCPDAKRRRHRQGHHGHPVDLPRPQQPEVDPELTLR